MIKIGILASGEGTSFEALETRIQSGELEGFEIAAVACNKPQDQAGIYARAAKFGTWCVHAPTVEAQMDFFENRGVDLVLCLGYTQKVGEELVAKYENRIWNMHPSLLPKYGGKGMYGLAPHKKVIENGDVLTGATVHLVNRDYDAGEILQQITVEVPQSETPERLQKIVLHHEYVLLANTLRKYKDDLLANCPRG